MLTEYYIMASIHDILQEQKRLADRLIYLDKLIELLIKDDSTRHSSTIDYYINQQAYYIGQAEALNETVEQIIEQAKKNARNY